MQRAIDHFLQFMKDFEQADRVVHPVEKEWHYPILIKYGYVPITKEAVGFVRFYDYEHPITKHKIKARVGVNADYWSADDSGGYWSELEPYLVKISTTLNAPQKFYSTEDIL